MRFLLDEMFSSAIAERLRDRGIDATSIHEEGMRGTPDPAVWQFAQVAGRAVVTENVADFVAIVQAWAIDRRGHFGLVLTSSRSFPRNANGANSIADALEQLARDQPSDGADSYVGWLSTQP